MIKGHYIATVIIDIETPEDPNFLPFDEIKGIWEGLDVDIKKVVEDEICGSDPRLAVTVSKRYSNIYKTEDMA